jgi:long-chain acyl-CoA synthetase
MTTNLANLLLGPDAQLPSNLIFFRDRVVSGTDLVASTRRLAQTLAATGLPTGAAVGGLLPNHPHSVAAIFAVWAAGGVYVPLNPRAPRGELEASVSNLHLAAVIGRTEALEQNPEVFGDAVRVSLGDWEVSGAIQNDVKTHAVDVALILSTSGTTGAPKPVVLKHAAWADGIEAILRKLNPARAESPASASSENVNIIPFSLSLGAGIYNVCFSLRAGRAIALMDQFRPGEFAQLVERFAVTAAVLAPPMITMLLDDPSITRLAPLRYVRSITAPLAAHRARELHDRFGVFVLNGYGQTELGEVIGWSAADVRTFGQEKLGAIGRAHAGVEIRFSEDGELLVRSPFVMDGYLDGDMDDRMTDDGFLATGDVGHIDDDGFVWLSGRMSDMINRGGLKVFPDEVESVLLRHPMVRDVAVVGVPDARLGEVPWAFYVPSSPDEGAVPAEDLSAFCAQSLVPYKVPSRYLPVNALPRNDVGKVLRGDLANRHREMAVE